MSARLTRLAAGLLTLLASTAGASAANLTLMVPATFRPVAQDVVLNFQKTSGNTVTLVVDSTGGMLQRMRAGQGFDVVVITQDAADQLADFGTVTQGSVTPLAKVGIGVAVGLGAPQPFINSTESFRETLLHTRRITYPDPVTGGVAGLAITAIIQTLGITTALERRTILARSARPAELVGRGQADLALDQVSELRMVPSVRFAGLIPSGVQVYVGYAGAIAATTREREAATALLNALADPSVEPILKRRGLEIP
jgi:molybdate transport system substrate-binding protein